VDDVDVDDVELVDEVEFASTIEFAILCARSRAVAASYGLSAAEKQYIQQALYQAASTGDLQTVKRCSNMGADIHAPCPVTGMTPLAQASCLENGLPMVRLLIELGADVNAQSPNQGVYCGTPLAYAARYNQVATAEYLVQRGAKLDNGHDASPHRVIDNAIVHGSTECYSYLRKQGAQLQADQADRAIQLLKLAARGGSRPIIEDLMSEGLKPIGPEYEEGQAPFDIATQHHQHTAIAAFLRTDLIPEQADIDRALGGQELLFTVLYAIRNKDIHALQTLALLGVDFTMKTESGLSLIQWAEKDFGAGSPEGKDILKKLKLATLFEQSDFALPANSGQESTGDQALDSIRATCISSRKSGQSLLALLNELEEHLSAGIFADAELAVLSLLSRISFRDSDQSSSLSKELSGE
ncbi:ankyrin repeat domain-containing protein, partial [Sansalvadorimonas verongulae]|uniref:ankyrin repeat domain-containing protein n=1 Tax=Sansalvadorimonas verongulae TaxID=2172824 RepID=UPI0012BBE7B8